MLSHLLLLTTFLLAPALPAQAMVSTAVSFGQQTGISFQLGASRQQGKADDNELIHDNTQITTGNTLALQSGHDTTLSGAQIGRQAPRSPNWR